MGLKEEALNRWNLVEAYLHLTKEVRHSHRVVDEFGPSNRCLRRIILDTICGDVWYAHLNRLAHKNLTLNQAQRAVDLCREIAKGRADLRQFNNQSLIWRGKRPKVWTAFEEMPRCLREGR